MKIGGFQKFSLIDYPGKIAAVVFTQGCNFRCSYCHNPELVYPHQFQAQISENVIFDFLKKRTGKLDAVAISGGEPTIQTNLPQFIRKIKNLGFLVKLDTNGTNPLMLRDLIEAELVDYLAMDIKAPLNKYSEIIGANVDVNTIKRSIVIIMNSRLEYEFRSTLVKNLLTDDDVMNMGLMLGKAKRYFLQKFVPTDKSINNSKKLTSFSQDSLNFLKTRLADNFGEFMIR